jgi:hypothetical protein
LNGVSDEHDMIEKYEFSNNLKIARAVLPFLKNTEIKEKLKQFLILINEHKTLEKKIKRPMNIKFDKELIIYENSL